MNIAIVDENKTESDKLKNYVLDYFKSVGVTACVNTYPDVVLFLSGYRSCYDGIFIRVHKQEQGRKNILQMLRLYDDEVPIVLLAESAEHTIIGFDINAVGALLTPLNLNDFLKVMPRVVRAANERTPQLVIKVSGKACKISYNSIYYIEVSDHNLTYHTVRGPLNVWGTLIKFEKILPPALFVRISKCYIVNLHYVNSVKDNCVYVGDNFVGGGVLTLSRNFKKNFMQKWSEFSDCSATKNKK